MKERFWNVYRIVMYIFAIGGIGTIVLSDYGRMKGNISGYEADLLWSRGFWTFVIFCCLLAIRYILNPTIYKK